MREEILKKLELIFCDKLENEDFQISEDLELSDIEDYDSLVHFEIVLEVESEFDISFSTKEIASIESISKLLHLIESKKAI